MTYADLEYASPVLLVCFEPEEEAGAVFLRLRKAFRKQGLQVAHAWRRTSATVRTRWARP